MDAPAGTDADPRRRYFNPTPLGTAVARAEGRRLEKLNENLGLTLKALPLPKPNMGAIIKMQPKVRTVVISVGRKNKVRPGDIVGALTATKDIKGDQIGSIQVQDFSSYVAVPRALADKAVEILRSRPLNSQHWLIKLGKLLF